MENKGDVRMINLKKSILAIIASTGLLLLQGCVHFYSAKGFGGTVIDAETKMPIEGAVIVARWVPYHARPASGGHFGPMEVQESVTDKDGKYYIPGWWLRITGPLSYLDNRDPELLIFKTGYAYRGLSNMDKEKVMEYVKAVYGNLNIDEFDSDQLLKITQHLLPTESNAFLRECIWNGRAIRLYRPADEEDYWSLVSFFQTAIGWSGDDTDWKSIKKAVREIEKARKNKPEKYYLSTLPENAKSIIFGEDKP